MECSSEKKRKKTLKTASGDSDSDGRTAGVERRREDFKVVCKLAQVGATFGSWNPIQLTRSLSKEIGAVLNAKITGQQGRAFRTEKNKCQEIAKFSDKGKEELLFILIHYGGVIAQMPMVQLLKNVWMITVWYVLITGKEQETIVFYLVQQQE